jgi:hypothetical protein
MAVKKAVVGGLTIMVGQSHWVLSEKPERSLERVHSEDTTHYTRIVTIQEGTLIVRPGGITMIA